MTDYDSLTCFMTEEQGQLSRWSLSMAEEVGPWIEIVQASSAISGLLSECEAHR